MRNRLSSARLVYKPSSVLNGHLSRRYVAVSLKRLMERAGNPYAPCLASSGVYITLRHRFVGELLPRLSTLTQHAGRFFSVALSLKSPSQVFHLHPCPMMLGLSSRYFYPATVRLTRKIIISQYVFYCNRLSLFVFLLSKNKKKSSRFDLIL